MLGMQLSDAGCNSSSNHVRMLLCVDFSGSLISFSMLSVIEIFVWILTVTHQRDISPLLQGATVISSNHGHHYINKDDHHCHPEPLQLCGGGEPGCP